MTSDQIKNENNLDSQYFWIWLKECAYQLAVMNEGNASGLKYPEHYDTSGIDKMEKMLADRTQSLGSTVPPDSDSALRETYCERIVHAKTHRVDPAVPEGKISATFWVSDSEYQSLLATPLPTSGPPTPDLADSQNSNTNEQADRKLVPIWVRDWVREYVQQEFDKRLGSTVPPDSDSALRGKHPYTSTACQHALHDRCRLSCKFCASPCMCPCHEADKRTAQALLNQTKEAPQS
jgi:hypothetical protein